MRIKLVVVWFGVCGGGDWGNFGGERRTGMD